MVGSLELGNIAFSDRGLVFYNLLAKKYRQIGLLQIDATNCSTIANNVGLSAQTFGRQEIIGITVSRRYNINFVAVSHHKEEMQFR